MIIVTIITNLFIISLWIIGIIFMVKYNRIGNRFREERNRIDRKTNGAEWMKLDRRMFKNIGAMYFIMFIMLAGSVFIMNISKVIEELIG